MALLMVLKVPLAKSLPKSRLPLPEEHDRRLAVEVEGLVYRDTLLSRFLLPGEQLRVRLLSAPAEIRWQFTGGEVEVLSPDLIRVLAPEAPGIYPIQAFLSNAGGPALTINVIVLVPYQKLKNDSLNGYRIGRYPEQAYKGLEAYRPPRGFVEVTHLNEETFLTPSFRLGQFVCKQPDGYPKYVALQEELLLTLERLARRLRDLGYLRGSIEVMSGYRTPAYNRSIGNGRYSQHIYGGAADIFVDELPRDGVLDDLNGDGKINRKDAELLARIIEELDQEGPASLGGLGWYETTRAHGPFVHLDVRGFRARW